MSPTSYQSTGRQLSLPPAIPFRLIVGEESDVFLQDNSWWERVMYDCSTRMLGENRTTPFRKNQRRPLPHRFEIRMGADGDSYRCLHCMNHCYPLLARHFLLLQRHTIAGKSSGNHTCASSIVIVCLAFHW